MKLVLRSSLPVIELDEINDVQDLIAGLDRGTRFEGVTPKVTRLFYELIAFQAPLKQLADLERRVVELEAMVWPLGK